MGNLDKTSLISELFKKAITESSDSISKLMDKPITINATESVSGPLLEIVNYFEPSEDIYTAVAMRIQNNAEGALVFFARQDDAVRIAQEVIEVKTLKSETTISEMTNSVLKEMANILFGAFLTRISEVSEIQLLTSIPDLTSDMVKASLDELCGDIALKSENALAVITSFSIAPMNASGKMVLIVDESTVNKILDKVK